MIIYNCSKASVKVGTLDKFTIYSPVRNSMTVHDVENGHFKNEYVEYLDGEIHTLTVEPLCVIYISAETPEGYSEVHKMRARVLAFGDIDTSFVSMKTYRVRWFRHTPREMVVTNTDYNVRVPISEPITRVRAGLQLYVCNKFFICWEKRPLTVIKTIGESGDIACHFIISERQEVGTDSDTEEISDKLYTYDDLCTRNGLARTQAECAGKCYFECGEVVTMHNGEMLSDIAKYSDFGSYVTEATAQKMGVSYVLEDGVALTEPLGSEPLEVTRNTQKIKKNELRKVSEPVALDCGVRYTEHKSNLWCRLECQEPEYVDFVSDARGFAVTMYRNVKAKVQMRVSNDRVMEYTLVMNHHESTARSVRDSAQRGEVDVVTLVGIAGKVGTFLETAEFTLKLANNVLTIAGDLGEVLVDLFSEVTNTIKTVKVNLVKHWQEFSVDELMKLVAVDTSNIVDTLVESSVDTSVPADTSVDTLVETSVRASLPTESITSPFSASQASRFSASQASPFSASTFPASQVQQTSQASQALQVTQVPQASQASQASQSLQVPQASQARQVRQQPNKISRMIDKTSDVSNGNLTKAIDRNYNGNRGRVSASTLQHLLVRSYPSVKRSVPDEKNELTLACECAYCTSNVMREGKEDATNVPNFITNKKPTYINDTMFTVGPYLCDSKGLVVTRCAGNLRTNTFKLVDDNYIINLNDIMYTTVNVSGVTNGHDLIRVMNASGSKRIDNTVNLHQA